MVELNTKTKRASATSRVVKSHMNQGTSSDFLYIFLVAGLSFGGIEPALAAQGLRDHSEPIIQNGEPNCYNFPASLNFGYVSRLGL